MFKKKYYFTIKLHEGKDPTVDHNFDEKTPRQEMAVIIANLTGGNFGEYILEYLAQNPYLKDFCTDMYLSLYPPQVESNEPIVQPDEMIAKFVHQLRGSVNE